MGTYPCSNCGARADTVNGCPQCGRSVEQEIAELSKVITKMQFRNKDMVEQRTLLMKRIQGAIATRSLLLQANEQQAKASGPLRRVRTPPPVGFGGARTVVPGQRPAPSPRPGKAAPLRVPPHPMPPRPMPPPPAAPLHHPPEASSLSMQYVVLWLGALLFAVTGTAYLLRTLGGGGRVAVFAVLASAVLAIAVPLGRRGLTATAETIATVGLIFVLLDGYAAWTARWFVHSGLPGSGYAGLVCFATAGVAVGYRSLTHLKAPRFATVLLLQPVLPLLALHTLHGPAGWATILAAVGLEDLVLALALRNRPDGTAYLEDAAWVLHGLAVVGALGCAVLALARAHTVGPALAGSAALLLTGAVALDGGLLVRRRPFGDVGAGIATVALIGAVGRLAGVAVPGRGLVFTALAVLLAAVGVRFLPVTAKLGPQVAGALSAGTLGLVILARGVDGIAASIRAALPAWHADLSRYADRVAHATGPDSGQLALAALILTVAAVLMLPSGVREDGAVAGVTLTLLLVPATLHLPWGAVPLALVPAAIVIGGYGLAATTLRSGWVRVSGAAVLGCYAAAVSLARPGAGALTLTALAAAGAMIGAAPRMGFTAGGPGAEVAAEAALGAAAFALPGAVAFATAALSPGQYVAGPILAAAYLAVAGTLGAAAIAQVARATTTALPTSGAALGALVVALAAFNSPRVALIDLGVAALLLGAGVLLVVAPLVVAPWLDSGRRPGARFDGSDVAAIGVTTAAMAALARVAALLVPEYPLATAAGLVLAVALGLRALPAEWRRGPVVGSGIVGALIAGIAGLGAVRGAVDALRAVPPIWHTNLVTWSAHHAGGPGPQIPVALGLLAVAAVVVLPHPTSQVVGVALAGLAALSVPAAYGLPWWSPILVSGLVSTFAGLAAAGALDPTVAWIRATVATLLFADTVFAGLVKPDVTAVTLLGSSLVYASVAGIAMRMYKRNDDADHLVQIGGVGLAGAMLTLAGATGCAAAAVPLPLGVNLTAALAGLCLGLAIVAVTVYHEAFLPYATGAVAIGGTAIAVGTLDTALPVGVYAAAAALLAVVAELLRNAVITRRANLSGSGLRTGPVRWRVRRLPARQGYVLLLAAGPATVLAGLKLAPSVAAALAGPYRWVGDVWGGPPRDSLGTLGLLASWVGGGSEVLAAMILTLAGTLGALGFGGSIRAVQARAVAVVIPGVAITLLISPYALRARWPDGPVAAVAVAVLAGLGVALTPTPPDTLAAEPLRAARRVVVVICLAAGGAGLAGSLATRSMTLTALSATVAAGLIAALAGITRTARLAGWLVASLSGNLLALVIGEVAGLPRYWSAFLVGAVAAAQLVIAALLPQLRRADAAAETGPIEASSYAGAVLALLLASQSLPHLAVFTCAWGAVLGIAAAKPGRARAYRSGLIWLAAAHEVAAWWLLMHIGSVALPEAYTLAVALVALITGYVEVRRHPEISSWYAYGIALVAAFLPTLSIVLYTGQTPTRRAVLIVAAAATVALGAWRRQQAPVVVGAVTLVIASLHELAVLSTTALLWTVMALVGAGLVTLGANFEKRRNDLLRLRGAFGRLR